jgi:ATP-dependent DNA helicase RecG
LSFIDRSYLKQTIIKYPDRPEADRVWNFPLAAIEEAVVNAVYHRSYEIREPIEVRISQDDIVVLSFPGPDRSIPLDQLRIGKAISRRYRNRRIGEFLKELELTEGRSTGISKILKVMKANGSPAPEFETDDERSYFLIRLPVHTQTIRESDSGNVTAQDTTQDTTHDHTTITIQDTTQDTTHDRLPLRVPPLVVQLLEACQDEMSREALQERLGLVNRRHFRSAYLLPALELDLLERTLPDTPTSRYQKYRISALGRTWLASRIKSPEQYLES